MKYEITQKGKYEIITVAGDIENDLEAQGLIKELTELLKKGKKHFCFNLESATYLNSSGISIFIHTLAGISEKKGSVFMVVKESEVRNVIELAGLDKLIQTYSNLEAFERENI